MPRSSFPSERPIHPVSPTDSYSTVEDSGFHLDYEYPNYDYLPQRHPTTPTTEVGKPSAPPPIIHPTSMQRFYSPYKSPIISSKQRFGFCLAVCGILALCLMLIFVWHTNHNNRRMESQTMSPSVSEETKFQNETNRRLFVDPLISANNLATLMATRHSVCIFEVSTNEAEQSRKDFEETHIYGSRLLFFSNLSHSGVPVHPLQFQRFIRIAGVDTECHVVLYDRGQQIWSTYAFWIFKLFGHERISILNGGWMKWMEEAKRAPNLYKMETGGEKPIGKLGDFRAEWKSDCIATFDDILSNFEVRRFDLVDAQSPEEFAGKAKGAVFGHIRSAVNIPIDEMFDWANNSWPSITQLHSLLVQKGLSITRPLVIYDGTSLRSTMIFFSLQRLHIDSAIYFGSWPEFLIRAPDHFKVLQ